MTNIQAETSQAVPWYFWAVGVIAILWNGYGTFLWGGATFMPETALEGFPQNYQDYALGLPIWSTITWGLGVLGGVIGSVLLLVRSPLAVPVFALSLIGAVTNSMVYFTNPPPEGFFNPVLTIFIIGFAVFLLWFAHFMKRRGVLG